FAVRFERPRKVIEDTLVNAQVLFRHPTRCEAFLKTMAHESSIQPHSTTDCVQAVVRFDSISSDPVINHLRYRAASKRDDRRAAGHSLDHHEPEWLRPADRK